jgi:hypothetical protein
MEERYHNALGDQRSAPSRAELEQHLRARAWKDDAYRQEFLAHPKAVLERDYAAWFPGGKFPSELSIKVIEEEEQTLCFVLPPKTPGALLGIGDLDEEEVLAVAGGVTIGSVCPTEGCTRANCTGKSYCHYCRSDYVGEVIGKIRL